jgi:hypothetical protein
VATYIEYAGVRISEGEICELNGRRRGVAVRREDIDRASVRRGWQAERPFLALAFGGVLLAVGLVPVPSIIDWLLHGGTLSVLWAAVTSMVAVGGWVVYESLRRGYFLAVEGRRGRRKLCFGRRAEAERIRSFLYRAEDLFAYRFHWDTPE